MSRSRSTHAEEIESPKARAWSRERGGPAWRQEVLVRAADLEILVKWLLARPDAPPRDREMIAAIVTHLDDARDAARNSFGRGSRTAADRAMTHLDAAELELLRIAPSNYVRAQLPVLLIHVRRNLVSGDPRREVFERVNASARDRPLDEADRDSTIACVRAANDEARRKAERIRNLVTVLTGATIALAIFALALVVLGGVSPDAIPLCFNPPGQIVCPTSTADVSPSLTHAQAVDAAARAAGPFDIALIALIGVVAAGIAGVAALRESRTVFQYSLALRLAVLKLPTGALTAVLGLVFMRGEFIPGFTALASAAQILAWGIILGYAQQLFTRYVDLQAIRLVQDADAQQRGPESVSAHELSSGFSRAVVEFVPDAVRETIAPPELVNFEGWLSVRVVDDHGDEVAINAGPEVVLERSRRYTLIVSIGTEAAAPLTLPVHITDGVQADEAPFTIKLDSDDPRLRAPQEDVRISTSAGVGEAEFPLELSPEVPEALLWIRVAQREQFVQHVEMLAVAQIADEADA